MVILSDIRGTMKRSHSKAGFGYPNIGRDEIVV